MSYEEDCDACLEMIEQVAGKLEELRESAEAQYKDPGAPEAILGALHIIDKLIASLL